MKIETGYLYHIKDEFFDIVNDENLMTNHERGKKRPTYFTIKDKDILWFIPLSSKVDKYKKIVDKKTKKYGVCMNKERFRQTVKVKRCMRFSRYDAYIF